MCFFSPTSVNVSPLSLHHFKFTEKSIDSVSLFFYLFVFAVVDDDYFAVFVVTVMAVGTIVAVIRFVFLVFCWFFNGSLLFFLPFVPGSPPSLSVWSLVSGLELSLVAGVIFWVAVVAAADIVVVVVVVVVGCIIVLVVF